jgi:long-chain acyl-CoA synthetase
VVVTRPGSAVTLEELREHCAARIARYKLPKSLTLVDQLPVSSAGKILKHQLRAENRSSAGPS